MEATHLTRRQRRNLSVLVLFIAGTSLGTAVAVAWALPDPAVFFAGLAALGVAVPLMSLAIGWPILLIFGGKAALDLIRRWRRNALRGCGEGSTAGPRLN